MVFSKEPLTKNVDIASLLEKNNQWASQVTKDHPGFFELQDKGQNPPILWLGCSDSRVPPSLLVQVRPGDLFVHRNIGNTYYVNDTNTNAVVAYAVSVLKVRHIIVCGHNKCGAVAAGMGNSTGDDVLEDWLKQIRYIYSHYRVELSALNKDAQHELMCQINAIHNANLLSKNKHIREAWENGAALNIHAMCYKLNNGRLEDLSFNIGSVKDCEFAYEKAISSIMNSFNKEE